MRHVRRVVWLQRLAGRRRRAGDTAFAEGLYRRALAVAERHLPDDDLATARVRNDLAVLLKYTGGFDEAAQLYAAALRGTDSAPRSRRPRGRHRAA